MGVEALLIKIDRVRDRERTVAVTAGLLKFVLAIIGLVAGFFVLDWLILGRLVEGPTANRLARGVILIAMAGTVVYVFWACVWRELVRELDDDEIALRVEARHQELAGRLISTIQLTRDLDEPGEFVGSEELIRALEADTVSFAGGLNFADIVSLQTLKKVAIAATAFTLLSVAMGAWRLDYAEALLGRMLLSGVEYPTATRILSVTPGCVVARGEPHEVEVELDPEGYLPEETMLVVRATAGGGEFEREMTAAEGEGGGELIGPRGGVVYRRPIDRVMESLEYRVFAYDARSVGWERLQVFRRPDIKSLELTYTYPEYTVKPGRKTSVGDIRAIEGTEVEIVARLNKPVVSARLLMRVVRRKAGARVGIGKATRERPSGAADAAGRLGSTELAEVRQPYVDPFVSEPVAMQLNETKTVATATVRVESDGYYKIELVDAENLANKDPIEHVIDAVRDKAPSVRLTFPGRDKTVTRFAVWPIRFEARDDFGITRGWLKYRVSSEEAGVVFDPFVLKDETAEPSAGFELEGLVRSGVRIGGLQREIKAEAPFDLQLLDIRPGQRLTYWIEIADNRTPEPNVGRSRPFEFIIAEAEEVMFTIGVIQEEALGRIDTIIKKEKETKDGVDNIRRLFRHQTGRQKVRPGAAEGP